MCLHQHPADFVVNRTTKEALTTTADIAVHEALPKFSSGAVHKPIRAPELKDVVPDHFQKIFRVICCSLFNNNFFYTITHH